MKNTLFVGRRKTSVARAYIKPGTGQIKVNKDPIETYFPMEVSQQIVSLPFVVTENVGKYDAFINIRGGGISGQAGAAQLAIARALVSLDENLRTKLRSFGLLTRDPRMVERKKYGQPGARKRFQFSKR